MTVDWFHVVQLFTTAVDQVRKAEAKQSCLQKSLRWAVLKVADGKLTDRQASALAELEVGAFFTATAWRIKEKLRWIRKSASPRAARRRPSSVIYTARRRCRFFVIGGLRATLRGSQQLLQNFVR